MGGVKIRGKKDWWRFRDCNTANAARAVVMGLVAATYVDRGHLAYAKWDRAAYVWVFPWGSRPGIPLIEPCAIGL